MNPWTGLGVVFLSLGAVGVVVPLLPTTPFVLLAAGCFARSSPRMHRWLHESALFGPVLKDWEQKRCIARRARAVALLMMLGVGGCSILLFISGTVLKLMGVALILTGCLAVLAVPVCPDDNP